MQPLPVVRNLLSENPDMMKNLDQVGNHFKNLIQEKRIQIPSINDVTMDYIQPNSLVKFRGMVQDMLDPEFYLGKYYTVNRKTNEKVLNIGCFTDTGDQQTPDDVIDFNSVENVTLERQTLYCVPVPGENKWLKNLYKGNDSNKEQSNDDIQINTIKRGLDEDEEMTEPNNKIIDIPDKKLKETKAKQDSCIADNVSSSSDNNSQETKPKRKIDYAKNFPLEEEKGLPAFVKIYSKNTELKLNDVVEFVCIFSVDPHFGTSNEMFNESEKTDVTWQEFNMEEDRAHCPPPSLVPRLHCLFYNKIEDSNPHVRSQSVEYENVGKELTPVRADLIQVFKKLLGGDGVAAEYLLLHLIASVYGRVGAMCIGKLSLNLFKLPSSLFCERLYKFLEEILPKSHYLPMSLDNLNNKLFVPYKDFEANRLASGLLQLSNGTNLVLDETKMEPGKLDTDGLKNLTALGNITQWQKLEYDFKYNRLDIETNINVLILSEGKSLVKCDCLIPVQLNNTDNINCADQIADKETEEKEPVTVSEKLLNKFRLYLSIVRQMKYELTEEVQKALEDDFVEMRKENSKDMNADAFYVLLTTARYLALSHGQTTLSASLWTRVKELDLELKKRLSS